MFSSKRNATIYIPVFLHARDHIHARNSCDIYLPVQQNAEQYTPRINLLPSAVPG